MYHITEKDLEKTNIEVSLTLSPVKNVIADLSGIVGSFTEDLIGSFYPKIIRKKVNVAISELVNNAIENSNSNDGKINLNLKINDGNLTISVMNEVTNEQYLKVKDHINMINSTKEPKNLLINTLKQRRKERLKGGLGLMRLVTENKFNLSTNFDNNFIVVQAQLLLGG